MASQSSVDSPSMRTLLPAIKSSLESFLSSASSFSVIRTISQSRLTATGISASAPHTSTLPAAGSVNARTLFILDSSYNPPSNAHLSIALSALQAPDLYRYPKPHRLLLLFSTHNADKSPAPAAFEHRASMMTMFALDLLERIRTDGKGGEDVDIDVGLTTKPYYTDKSVAITDSKVYSTAPDSDETMHVHLAGYDTFIRIFTPKYYPNSTPPLSALAPYFEKHRLRITLRLEDEFGTFEDQHAFLQGLANGKLEDEGSQRAWAKSIELVEEGREAVGVSSTKVRQAVQREDWETVDSLVTKRVATWIRDFGLYTKP